jgi:streptomycin 6-kinase
MTTTIGGTLAQAVTASLQDRWPGARVEDLSTLPGGRSGVTLLAEVVGAAALPVQVVVKAAPEGRPAVGRHDVLRQAQVIASLADDPDVIVPSILATGTEPTAFYVMTRSAGEAVEPVLDAREHHLPSDLVSGRATAAARMLAALHRHRGMPGAATAIEPSPLSDELSRWQATAEAAEQAIVPHIGELAALLALHLPSRPAAYTLVHGDYRLGNVMFDGTQITGLIDWEIWNVTDPGIDLGWFLVFCEPGLFPGIGQPVEGMPTAAELIQSYQDAGARELADLDWYQAFGRFKMAAIMAHNLRRHREGRHIDPYQERLPPTIARLVETGIDKLSGGR